MSNRSMTDVAYQLLSKKKNSVTFNKLWDEVSQIMGYSENVAERKIASFYTSMMLDLSLIHIFMLLAAAAMTLGVLVYRTRQRPVVQISRETWEYYHTSLYSGYPSTPNRKDWNSRLLEDDLRYARQAGDLDWLDQLKRVQAAARCQTPQYNWYPACNIQLTDEPRLQGSIPLLTREEALTPDVQTALEEILFRFASLRCHPNSEGTLKMCIRDRSSFMIFFFSSL